MLNQRISILFLNRLFILMRRKALEVLELLYSQEDQLAHSRSFGSDDPSVIAQHNHYSNTVERRLTGYRHWEAEGHWETRITVPAWEETVTRCQCSCGAVRDP